MAHIYLMTLIIIFMIESSLKLNGLPKFVIFFNVQEGLPQPNGFNE